MEARCLLRCLARSLRASRLVRRRARLHTDHPNTCVALRALTQAARAPDLGEPPASCASAASETLTASEREGERERERGSTASRGDQACTASRHSCIIPRAAAAATSCMAAIRTLAMATATAVAAYRFAIPRFDYVACLVPLATQHCQSPASPALAHAPLAASTAGCSLQCCTATPLRVARSEACCVRVQDLAAIVSSFRPFGCDCRSPATAKLAGAVSA